MVKQGIRLFSENKEFRRMILSDVLLLGLFVLMHIYIHTSLARAFTTKLSLNFFAFGHIILSVIVLLAILLNAYHIRFRGSKIIINFGMIWGVLLGYLTVASLAVNFLRFLSQRIAGWTGIEAVLTIAENLRIVWIAVIAGLAIFLLIGAARARFPKTKKYDVTIHKAWAGQLRIALLADLHYGDATSTSNIQRIAKSVNAMEPDIIVLAGDIVDLPLERAQETDFRESIQQLRAKRGVYAVLGNHEYMNSTIAGKPGETSEAALDGVIGRWVKYYESCGLTVLRDDVLDLGDFAIIGRDDRYADNWRFSPRRSVRSLCGKVADKDKPIILADHQPEDIEEVQKTCVDVMLSGHTHAGQIFPLNLLMRAFHKFHYGLKKVGDLSVVVTSGAGSWGPPVRIGAAAEVVQIDVRGEAEA